jgi:glucose 1-dehydrogenase
MSLKDKVAIVTGGNSGISKSHCARTYPAGSDVVMDYISHPEATEELEQQIIALGDQAIGVKVDVNKVSDLQLLPSIAVAT